MNSTTKYHDPTPLAFAPVGSWIEENEEAPDRFAVWSPEGDIIGRGSTKEQAIEDARATVAGWHHPPTSFADPITGMPTTLSTNDGDP